MNRREFLRLGKLALVSAWLNPTGLFPQTQSDFSGKVSALSGVSEKVFRARPTKWDIVRNQPTPIWGFLPHTFAPLLSINQDEELDLSLHNQLAEESLGLHWHGIRVPNAMDGVPHLTQPPIALGKSYRYRFSSPDAGTFWYHTHSHSLMQLRMGLLGPLIVREKKPYPVDEDLLFLMNDWSLDRNMEMDRGLVGNQFFSHPRAAHDGLLGNIVTVNGKVNPLIRFAPNSRARLRFINAATARIFYIDIPSKINPHFVAIDGHPVPVEPYQKIALAPGMRMDIVTDVPDLKSSLQIRDSAYRINENLFRVLTEGKPIRKQKLSSQPAPLPPNPIPKLNPSQAQRIRISLAGGAMSMGMMRGMASGLFWTINGKAMAEDDDYNRPIFQVKQNSQVLLTLVNTTRFSHPIHLHGHTFFILSRNGVKAEYPRPTDTLFMMPQERAEIGFVADNPGKWMFHCHIIDHQVSGMMGYFEVG